MSDEKIMIKYTLDEAVGHRFEQQALSENDAFERAEDAFKEGIAEHFDGRSVFYPPSRIFKIEVYGLQKLA